MTLVRIVRDATWWAGNKIMIDYSCFILPPGTCIIREYTAKHIQEAQCTIENMIHNLMGSSCYFTLF